MAGSLLGKRLNRFASRSRPLQYIFWGVDALALAIFWAVMKLLGPDKASGTGAALLSRLGPLTAKHRHLLTNLAIMFPDMGQDELAVLARKSWGNFGAILAEYPHIKRIVNEPHRLEVVGSEHVKSIVKKGEKLFFVSPHMGNWELIPACGLREGWPPTSFVYSPQQNPIVDRMVQYFRQLPGIRGISGKGGAAGIHAELRSANSIALLPDQRVAAHTLYPFFGVDAQTTTAPARMALASGRPLLPVWIERLHGAHFRLTVHEQVLPDDMGAPRREQAHQMTIKLNNIFEQWIRSRPEQWLCTKRRWPKR